MKVYKLSKKFLRKRYIMLSLTTLIILGILIIPIFTEETYPFVLIPFALIALLVFVIIPLTHLHYDLVLADDYIHKKHFFNGSKMKIEDMKEYKFKEGKIVIIPKTSASINIEIIPAYEEDDFNEIFAWLNKNIRNLEFETAIKAEYEEAKMIATNQDFGVSQNERFNNLDEARRNARILNIATYPLIAWLIFYPYPLKLVVSIAVIFPLIAIYLIHYYKGLLILFENKIKGKIYPILLPMFPLAPALCLRIILDFKIADHTHLWSILIVLTIIFTGIVYYSTRKVHFTELKDYLKLITPLIFFTIYSYGALMAINCYTDNSIPTRYKTTIVSKDEYNQKGRIKYHLTVEYWHNPKEVVREIEVAPTDYQKIKIGDNMLIEEKKGRLDIPHYEIVRIIPKE